MGESACLRRSFSDGANDPRMGDAIGALGDSISLGRFMSETLAWEKWSSFSQNRYLEEAEKISKPGSVAQKKAYFEAHYKTKAAKKAVDANNLPKPEPSDDSNMIIEGSGGQEQALDIDTGTDTVVGEIYSTSIDELENSSRPEGEEKAPNSQIIVELEVKSEMEEAEAAVIVQDPNENVNVEEERRTISIPPLPKEKEKENNLNLNPNPNPALRSNKKLAKSSSFLVKSSAQGGAGEASKLEASPSHARKQNNPPPSTKKPASLLALDKSPKSLHMSINFASLLPTRTSKKVSPVLQKNRNPRISAIAAKITKESTTPIRATVRASMSSAPTHPLENRRITALIDQSVSGGNRTAEGKWQSLLAERGQPSVACGSSKSRSPIISSPFRFRCEERVAKRKEFFQKLEEKNANEGETMQLRTKSKEKPETDLKKQRRSVTFKATIPTNSCCETETTPSLHMMKEKGEGELKKLKHSITFKPGSCPETDLPGNQFMKQKYEGEIKKLRHSVTFKPGSYHETDLSGNQVKKTPPTRPWSPKLGRKPTSSVIQDTNSRPPRSARIDSYKPATEKNKLVPPKKISQENASPNIQH